MNDCFPPRLATELAIASATLGSPGPGLGGALKAPGVWLPSARIPLEGEGAAMVNRRRRTCRQARLIAGLIILAVGALAAVALASAGQPGAIDTTFANHGIVSFGSGRAA